MNPRWSGTTLGCVVSGALFHAGVLLALLVVWLAVGLPLGSWRLRAVEEAWSQPFSNEQLVQSRGPVREHSAGARRLDVVARELGTNLVVTEEDRKTRDGLWDKPEAKESREFLSELGKRNDDAEVAVPESLVRLVQGRSRTLANAEEVLLGKEGIEWQTPVGAELTVSWLGLRNVHTLLLIRSLVADRRRAIPERDRALDAAGKLTDTLWSRTDMAERMLAASMARGQNACLRRFVPTVEAWRERLRGAHGLMALADAYRALALAYSRHGRRLMGFGDLEYLQEPDLPEVGPGGWVFRVATAPYLRLSVAGYSNALRAEVERLRSIDPCTLLDGYADSLKAAQPAWNILARVAIPTDARSWLSGRDAALDDELTEAVMEVRGLPATAIDEWHRPSSTCAGLTWVATKEGGGGLVVESVEDAAEGVEHDGPRRHYTITRR